MFYDRDNGYLYFVEADNTGLGANGDLIVKYIDLSDDSITTIGTYTHGAAHDLIPAGDVVIAAAGTIFLISAASASDIIVCHWGGAAWVVDDTQPTLFPTGMGFAIKLSDTVFYFLGTDAVNVYMFKYDNGTTTLTRLDTITGVMPSLGQRGLTYDGSNIIHCIIKRGGVNKLCSYDITGDSLDEIASSELALMLDRNCSNTVPNEYEKGFDVTNAITYETKSRRGGVIRLQDLAPLFDGTSEVILAITDNFCIINVDDIYYVCEFTDVEDYMAETSMPYGIVPFATYLFFKCHPNYSIYWNEDDSIKLYDKYDQLCFWGIIISDNKDAYGIPNIEATSFGNEVYHTNHEESFSADETSTKIQTIIDSTLFYGYRSSSITATTTTYNYAYNRACAYIFWLDRFLEKQVPYIEPDGKIYTRDYDKLLPQHQFYPGTYTFKDEEVDTSGTSIGFVDSATLYDGECIIVDEWQGHRKVLRLQDDATADEDPVIIHHETLATAGIREFYIGTDDITEEWRVYYGDDDAGVTICGIRIRASKIEYLDDGGWQDTGLSPADNTLYHVKIQWYADNTVDYYVNGVLEADGVTTLNNMTNGIDMCTIRCFGDSADYLYLDAYGDVDNDTNYDVGDNLVAWTLNSGYQDVHLVDIKGFKKDEVPGYYKGNTGVTSVVIRYFNNEKAIRPATPTETLRKIRAREFPEPKIQALTEANQLGDNIHAILSADTTYIGLRVANEGWLQPGRTLHFQAVDQIIIAEGHYLILRGVYDPKNDVHSEMILSDNIIFPSEFISKLDTREYQTYTAMVTAMENQANTPRIYTSAGDPTVNDDTDLGYKRGDIWINTADDGTFICRDNTDGAADWKEI